MNLELTPENTIEYQHYITKRQYQECHKEQI